MKIKETIKKNYMIFKHEYVNLTDFLNTLNNNKINYKIFGDYLSSEKGDYNFTKTSSFEDAWNMCRFGWNEGFEEFHDEIKRIELQYVYKFRKVNTYKPIGCNPSVPRYLLGIPNNMHFKEKIYDKKVIDIYFDISYSHYVTFEQIINRGILTLALINYLEKTKFFAVNLHFIGLSKCDDEILFLDIPLKKEKEQLNIKKCYFPIVHPSFLRRLCFRALEITNVTNKWNNGYGQPLSIDDSKFILDNSFENVIYISAPDKMGIKGNDIEEDLENFINVINTKYGDILDENNNGYTKTRRL